MAILGKDSPALQCLAVATRIAGFRAGVSFTPDNSEEGTQGGQIASKGGSFAGMPFNNNRGHWVGDDFPVCSLFSYDKLGAHSSPFLPLDYADQETAWGRAASPSRLRNRDHRL